MARSGIGKIKISYKKEPVLTKDRLFVLPAGISMKVKTRPFSRSRYGGPQGIRTPDLLVRSSAKAAFLSDFCATFHIILRYLQTKLVILLSVQTYCNISLHTKCTRFCIWRNCIDQKVIGQNAIFLRFITY